MLHDRVFFWRSSLESLLLLLYLFCLAFDPVPVILFLVQHWLCFTVHRLVSCFVVFYTFCLKLDFLLLKAICWFFLLSRLRLCFGGIIFCNAGYNLLRRWFLILLLNRLGCRLILPECLIFSESILVENALVVNELNFSWELVACRLIYINCLFLLVFWPFYAN